MTVIARDAVAADHLVYAWPFPIGPECDVTCADDDSVVMCPAWLVGDRLGPGRHHWRSPDPTRPVSAYFVLSQPVEVSFDLSTFFTMPSTSQLIRLRAVGSLQVRCQDPALLVAQFVGLPFDHVNDGILRSVSRSVERMLARLLIRRVVMAGTPSVVTEAAMLPHIIEELVAYNPAAGAVFGIELIRMGHLTITSDDGAHPTRGFKETGQWGRVGRSNGDAPYKPALPTLDTARGVPAASSAQAPTAPLASQSQTMRHAAVPAPAGATPTEGVPLVVDATASGKHRQLVSASGEIVIKPPLDIAPRPAQSMEIPRSEEDTPKPVVAAIVTTPTPGALDAHSSILGIGMTHIGDAATDDEPPKTSKIAPGARVLVPGPNGLMQSATVRQLLQGYYELEVGSSGETIWVPVGGVVPE